MTISNDYFTLAINESDKIRQNRVNLSDNWNFGIPASFGFIRFHSMSTADLVISRKKNGFNLSILVSAHQFRPIVLATH